MTNAEQENFANFSTADQLTAQAITEAAYEAVPRLEGIAVVTPLEHSSEFSTDGVQVSLKNEAMQPGRSFKRRGGGNSVGFHHERGAQLVVASSAGSLGESVAAAAKFHSIEPVIFMGRSATAEKQRLIAQHGAKIHIEGDNFDEALVHGLAYSEREGGHFVHPVSPLVIAGHATMGLELVEQEPDMTHLLLPVGTGGMLAGVASVVKEHLPDVKVVAVQVEGCEAYADSMRTGLPVRDQGVDRRFEGVAVRNVDPLALAIGQRVVDEVLVVPTNEVYRTIYEYSGVLLETAGAVSPTGGRLIAPTVPEGSKLVAVASGANPPPALRAYVNAMMHPIKC